MRMHGIRMLGLAEGNDGAEFFSRDFPGEVDGYVIMGFVMALFYILYIDSLKYREVAMIQYRLNWIAEETWCI